MRDLWKKIPKRDWKIAQIIGFTYRPVVHGSDGLQVICDCPEICGRYCHELPWSAAVQARIDLIKSNRL